ncbi:hypothetical protein P7C70_g3119, partial [Phenoliferia sp. Uapishka_3]
MNVIPTLRTLIGRRLLISAPLLRAAYSTAPTTSSPAAAEPSSKANTSAPTPTPTQNPSRSSLVDGFLTRTASTSPASPNIRTRNPWSTKLNGVFDSAPSNAKHVETEQSPQSRWAQTSPAAYSQPITTTSERSFSTGKDGLAMAFRKLNKVLMENNVKREVRRGERFEGRSDKRVRLDSERHRRRFKVAVGKAVSSAMRASKNS